MTLFTNHPKVGELASFNQALCGLYAAGVGAPSEPGPPPRFRRSSGRRATTSPWSSPAPRQARPAPRRCSTTGTCRACCTASSSSTRSRTRVRREIAERHITRLVKGEDGTGTFQTIDDPADVIKLAGRAGEFDLGEEFGIDADRLAALGRETQLAIAAGIDALRDAGIPLVQHYKDTTRGTKLPDKWRLPDALQDDTGVIFASAFPGSADFAAEMNAFWTERVKRARLEELSRGARPRRRRRGPRRDRPPDRRARARPRAASVPLRPPLPVPRALHGPLPARRADRGARAEHADQRRVREHDAGRRDGRGLDPRGALPARGDRGRRRRDLRRAAAVGRLGLPGLGRGGHRRVRRGRRAAVRSAPPRDDPRDGRGRHRGRERRGRARARRDARSARCSARSPPTAPSTARGSTSTTSAA